MSLPPTPASGTLAETGSGTASDIAVILIVRDPADTPDAVLAALAAQPEAAGFAVIVVDGRPEGALEELPEKARKTLPEGATQERADVVPGVVVIRAPGLNMPQLKARGVGAATAPALAFLEPKAAPAPGWAAALVRARAQTPQAALGGTVRFAGRRTAADQAAFIFEYADFSATGLASSRTRDLPGNNMVLPREALLSRCGDILIAEGLNKPFCQARLMAAGVPLRLVPDMAVAMRTTHRLAALLRSRMRYARCFGGTRAALAPAGQRWRYRLGAPVVPLLVLAKRLGAVGRAETGSRRPGTLPALVLLCLAWALGEVAGYWCGPGRACERLY